MLEAKSLRKAVIPASLLQNPSPGSLQSNRLAIHVSGDGSSCSVYVASGCRVYKIEISMEDLVICKGKDSLLIPIPGQVKHCALVDRCPHRSEIQTIVLAGGNDDAYSILGTVDSFGHLIVSRLETTGADRLSYSVLPRGCGVGEGSWAGVCFSPSHWSMVAVAQSFCKTIDLYDQDIHLQSLHTLWYPSCLTFLQSPLAGRDGSPVIAVGEGSQLSIWDLRMKENGGCVQRICGSIGDIIYAVSSSLSGFVATGGSDRTVTVYDPRRWSALSRWVNCSKYEITGLSFSSIDSDYIFVHGLDYEVICGQWRENEKAFSFRGDTSWLGFSKCQNADILGGWCESGSIFVVEVVKQWE